MKNSLLNQLVTDLWDDLHSRDVLWQMLVLALALCAAYLVSRQVSRGLRHQVSHSNSRETVSHLEAFGVAGAYRLNFPLLALGAVYLSRWGMQTWSSLLSLHLLDLAIPLLFSFALIRITVFILRKAAGALGSGNLLASSEKMLGALVWSVVALHITNLLPELLAWLESFTIPLGKHSVSILLLLQVLLSVVVTLLLALWAGSAVEQRLLRTEQLDSNLRVVLARLARAFLILLAILLSLSFAGLDLTVLSVFGGALGVGLGLGLQRIASNFVSGFVVLFEKSLRIGDLITVDKYYGRVVQIKTRFTVVQGSDGVEAIIPNELLISQPVQNHTYANRQVRVGVKLVITYDSDLHGAMRIMREAAQSEVRVLAEPPVTVNLQNFTLEGLELDLGFWIKDPEEGTGLLRSSINQKIWAGFQAAQIRFAPSNSLAGVSSAGMPAKIGV